MKALLTLLLALMLVCVTCSAIPTTGPAAAVGVNNATISATGVSGTVGWFLYGMAPGATWSHLPNQTATGGAMSLKLNGATTIPMLYNQAIYYRACDPTGCGSEMSFTPALPTPLPQVVNGDIVQNITENGLDPQNLVWNSIKPFTQITGLTIFTGLIFAMIVVGIWLRTRGTAAASMIGIIYAGLFISSTAGMLIGLPPEFAQVGEALMIVSFAGSITMFTFK